MSIAAIGLMVFTSLTLMAAECLYHSVFKPNSTESYLFRGKYYYSL